MTVYIVLTNGEEAKGEVEGVYSTYEKAKAKLEAVKQEWLEWAYGQEYEDTDEEDYYALTSFEADEFMEVWITAEEVE